jgi:phosphorylase kinase alpha/beta subunit
MLFLVEPLDVLTSEQAARVVTDVETHLVREHGVIRYIGDTYWGPRFKDLMRIEERTSQAPGRLEERNQKAAGVAYSKTEAQWTLSDAPLSTYHGKEYLRTNSRVEHSKQLLFLNRVLSQLVLTEGKLLLPEAFYVEQVPAPSSKPTNQWIPNDHSPLLWAQANLLLALKTFEQTGV